MGGLSSLQRYNIIEKVVTMEMELASLEFPAYGALYLHESAPTHSRHHALPQAPGHTESFCVGPLCEAHTNHDRIGTTSAGIAFGPCEC